MASNIQYNQLQQPPLIKGSDQIAQLPADHTQPSHNELQIVNTLFKENKSTMDVLALEAKDSVIIGALFVVFSLPQVDELLHRFIPLTSNSPYASVFIKALCFMVLYWFIKHFYLSRQNQ
jgi:hypothetical protein